MTGYIAPWIYVVPLVAALAAVLLLVRGGRGARVAGVGFLLVCAGYLTLPELKGPVVRHAPHLVAAAVSALPYWVLDPFFTLGWVLVVAGLVRRLRALR